MNTNNAAVDMDKMARAFDLVNPAIKAKSYADAGLISQEDAAAVSWKRQIADIVLDSELAVANVTIDDVGRAVEFYTATKASITRTSVGMMPLDEVPSPTPRMGYLVMALGYSAGPAGDH